MISYSQEFEDDEEHLDYSGFRLFVLRKAGVVVSVATLRWDQGCLMECSKGCGVMKSRGPFHSYKPGCHDQYEGYPPLGCLGPCWPRFLSSLPKSSSGIRVSAGGSSL